MKSPFDMSDEELRQTLSQQGVDVTYSPNQYGYWADEYNRREQQRATSAIKTATIWMAIGTGVLALGTIVQIILAITQQCHP